MKRSIKNGLTIGRNCYVGRNVFFDPDFSWLITIGNDCTLTDNVKILAHDASIKKYTGYTKIGAVSIGNRCFVGMGATILPCVHIGNNAIIGAGSVVVHDVPSNSVAGGNPAKIIDRTENLVSKHLTQLRNRPKYLSKGWTLDGGITSANKKVMHKAVEYEIGYIE